MAFKMKGHALPGINQRKSPAKQKTGKKKSPGKWAQLIPIALSVISSMQKNKEEE